MKQLDPEAIVEEEQSAPASRTLCIKFCSVVSSQPAYPAYFKGQLVGDGWSLTDLTALPNLRLEVNARLSEESPRPSSECPSAARAPEEDMVS